MIECQSNTRLIRIRNDHSLNAIFKIPHLDGKAFVFAMQCILFQ